MVDVLAAPRTVVSRARVLVLTSAHTQVLLPLAIFVFTRLVGGLVLDLMSDQQIARVPQPTMHVVDPAPADPGYLDMLTNWDGQWYQDVAQNGYPRDLPRIDGVVDQNTWAFYPLYPALVRLVMLLTTLPFAAAAALVSMAAGGAAMVVLFQLLDKRVGRFNAGMTVLAISLSPAGVLLQTAYTESLALLVLVVCLALLVHRRYGALALAAVLLSLTRPIVLPLALLILLHGVDRWRRRGDDPFPTAERRRWLTALVVAGASFGLWPLAFAVYTGEPGAFLETQDAWISTNAAERSWLGSILHHPSGTASLLALTALAVALAIVCRPGARAWGSDLRLWVPIYAVYLLATASPVASAVRYSLLTVVPWWPVTESGPTMTRSRKVIVAGFAVAFGILCQVAWVRYFYVLGPDQAMFP